MSGAQGWCGYCGVQKYPSLSARVAELEAEVARLRGALELYAQPGPWSVDVARAALSPPAAPAKALSELVAETQPPACPRCRGPCNGHNDAPERGEK